MASSLLYVLKILLLSGLISYGIKIIGPWLAIPGSLTNVLLGITVPTIVMAILLGLRASRA